MLTSTKKKYEQRMFLEKSRNDASAIDRSLTIDNGQRNKSLNINFKRWVYIVLLPSELVVCHSREYEIY